MCRCGWFGAYADNVTWHSFDDNYRGFEQEVTIHGIKQRWVLIESRQAYEREIKTFHRRMIKKSDELAKKLWHLGNQVFKCEKDAEQALKPILKSLKYHSIHHEIIPVEKHVGKGRPKAGTPKQIVGFQIEATYSSCLEKIHSEKQSIGRFILATNQLDETILNTPDILVQYKEQSCVESGFKFIKNNTFELDSFYLKKPERIGALMMIMTLCLMVYNFAQYHMRQCMEEHGEVLPNQVGKPVKNPTIKWIAELMNMIAVVTIVNDNTRQRIVTNVKKVHQRIIAYFGPHALEIYGLPTDLERVDINYSNYKNLLHWCER